jgi:putative signal transducing protein
MISVYKASSVEQADIVVAWLDERGIPAFVKNRHMAGNYATFAVAPRGVEVCVIDPEEAERAKALLADHSKAIEDRRRVTPEKVVPVMCSGCGKLTHFPGELFGTVQSCPSCGQNLDVEDKGELPRYC